MPQIVFCGFPSSGKSTWAKKLSHFLETEKGKKVHIIQEESFFDGKKNDILDDHYYPPDQTDSTRLLNKEDVIVIDALNYIKGYRYELFCMSKAVPTQQVTVECEVAEATAWEWNLGRPSEEQYTRPVFEHLIQRFESPEPLNRWDSPYFSVLPDEELDCEGIHNSLFLSKVPKQNQSTQCKPLSGSSFLSSLEKVTSDIIHALMDGQKAKTFIKAENFHVPHSSIPIMNQSDSTMNLAQLTRFKRQFLTMTKAGSVEGDVGDLFVQYLNSQFTQHSHH